jgi:hypothetical protein
MNNTHASLFGLTLAVVREAERRVVSVKSSSVVTEAITRTVLFPFPFLQVGIMELFRPVSIWAALSFGMFLIASFLAANVPMSVNIKSYLLLACLYVPMFLVMFAVPSAFVLDSIKDEQIQALSRYMYNIGIDCERKVDAFEYNLKIISERAYARINGFKWFVATLWAIFLFAINQLNGVAAKISSEQNVNFMFNNIGTFVVYGLVFLFSVMIIVGHKKGNDAVFRRIQFAVQELRFTMICSRHEIAWDAF